MELKERGLSGVGYVVSDSHRVGRCDPRSLPERDLAAMPGALYPEYIVQGTDPTEAVSVRMISGLAMEINEEWMERKYLDMNLQENETRNCLLHAAVALQDMALSLHSMQGAPAGQI